MTSKPNIPKESHGSLTSYIIGFILSLFLTANAYYLVVSKSVTGTALLNTILVLGVLQMFVQIFFFLHLGRGPKPMYNVVFFGSTVGLILVVVIGSVFIMDNLHYNMAPLEVTQKLAQDEAIAKVGGKYTGACQKIGKNYKLTIRGSKVYPITITARLCDTLTFINDDDRSYDIVFGQYPAKDNYGGEPGLTVRKNNSKTITLNQGGVIYFHDKANPNLAGGFTVTP